MSDDGSLGLFEAFGVELEYMIVDRESLQVLPVADRLLEAEAGFITSDVEFEDITWSNELVLHVVELKVSNPARDLSAVLPSFNRHVLMADRDLEKLGGRLMPTAMHPFMDPVAEMRLWPHEYSPIYATFNRIFDCRGHGWANLQSMHLNLPFRGDEEFGRLHAAIRLILPVLPALAASSPALDGRTNGFLDNRLMAYRTNCSRIPSVAGRVIPEPVFSAAEYQTGILQKIYRDLAPFDPEGIIQQEWVNARGAIARFDRDTIEIRLIDVQECPAADLAVAAAVIGALRLLAEETWSGLSAQRAWPVDPLADILDRTMRDGDLAVLDNPEYLRIFGWNRADSCTAGELWGHLIDSLVKNEPSALASFANEMSVIRGQGPLARRILRALGPNPPGRMMEVYRGLCDCLEAGAMFRD